MHTPATLSSGSLYSPCGQRKYLTAVERDRFIGAALACERAELRSFCLVLAYTGCRISEALDLRAGAIDPESGVVAVRSLKKRSRGIIMRQIPIPLCCAQILCDVHQLHGTLPQRRLWPWSRSRAWQLVKFVMMTAGIAGGIHASPKGLRHGFGLHAITCGVPLNLVQRWLGHARLETTAIYLQAMGPEERDIAARMWQPMEADRSYSAWSTGGPDHS